MWPTYLPVSCSSALFPKKPRSLEMSEIDVASEKDKGLQSFSDTPAWADFKPRGMTHKMGLTYPEMSAQPTFKRQAERPWPPPFGDMLKDLSLAHWITNQMVVWIGPCSLGQSRYKHTFKRNTFFPISIPSCIYFKHVHPACVAIETTPTSAGGFFTQQEAKGFKLQLIIQVLELWRKR